MFEMRSFGREEEEREVFYLGLGGEEGISDREVLEKLWIREVEQEKMESS